MTKILFFFSSEAIIGGAERSLMEIIQEFLRRGRRCVLICPGGSLLQAWAADTDLPHETLDILPLSTRNPVRAAIDILRYRRFARKLIKKYGPGIFYSNTRRAFVALALLPAAYRKVAHHRDVASRRGNRVLYPKIDVNIFISQFNFTHSDHPSNGRVILNAGAIDCAEPPVLPEPDSGVLRLAMFARITPGKGHEIVVGSSLLLRQAGIAHQIDIWGEPYNGRRGEQLLATLEERILRNDLPVTFKGFHKDPSQVMRDYHVILNPSLDEPFGRVPVEGFSLGVPVISHASGGPLEIYSGLEEYKPYLFEDHTEASLAAALKSLFDRRQESETERDKLRKIQADIQTRFNVSRVVDEIEEVLSDVSSRHPSS